MFCIGIQVNEHIEDKRPGNATTESVDAEKAMGGGMGQQDLTCDDQEKVSALEIDNKTVLPVEIGRCVSNTSAC
jgi:hypothetical protein